MAARRAPLLALLCGVWRWLNATVGRHRSAVAGKMGSVHEGPFRSLSTRCATLGTTTFKPFETNSATSRTAKRGVVDGFLMLYPCCPQSLEVAHDVGTRGPCSASLGSPAMQGLTTTVL